MRWAREQIDTGRARAAEPERPHRITTFALCAVDDDSAGRARPTPGTPSRSTSPQAAPNALTDAYGISDELRALLADGGPAGLVDRMPDQWVDDLAVAGDPDECSRKIQTLLDAGLGPRGAVPHPGRERAADAGRAGRFRPPALRAPRLS